jgi:hypothetical protein
VAEEEKVEPGEEESEGLKDLIKEGEKDDGAGGGEGDDDEKDDKKDDKKDDDSSVDEKLAALREEFEGKLAEKDAENVFLRGEVSKLTNRREDKVDDKSTKPLIDMDELEKKLTDRDPKVAARALVEVAEKIANDKIEKMRGETGNLLASREAVQAAKESDRTNVLNDFGDYLDDPDFQKDMNDIFVNTAKQAGGRYIKDSLYLAASAAMVITNKKRAAKNGTKNGVHDRKPAPLVDKVETSTDDYSKMVTIDSIPARFASDKEKAGMRGALKKMTGVTEKQWVQNFMEQQKDNEAV